MSNTKTNILEDISILLDHIESKLTHFESIYNVPIQIKKVPVELSHITHLYNRTYKIYVWTHANGSFPNENAYGTKKDMVSKWSTLVENLAWSIFGIEIHKNITETNRIKQIYMKLVHINNHLDALIPSSC